MEDQQSSTVSMSIVSNQLPTSVSLKVSLPSCASFSFIPSVSAINVTKQNVPAMSNVIIPNVLAFAKSSSINNLALINALSITQTGSSVLPVQKDYGQNIVIPAAISKPIVIVPVTKVLRHSCGVPKACFYCKAMRWPAEDVISETCCSEGTVRLDAIQDPPEPLRSLLTGTHLKSSHFKQHHREYNCAFQMASSTAQIAAAPPGISSVIMSGRLYHRIGPLFPQTGQHATYAQMFLLDSNEQATAQKNIFSNLDQKLLLELIDMMHDYNHYVHEFDYQTKRSTATATITIPTYWGKNKTYCVPTAPEIAAAIPQQSVNVRTHHARQIVVYKTGGALQTIQVYNAAFEPLHFVLLFPRGEEGWHPHIPLIDNPELKTKRKKQFVTRQEYFVYRVQIRNKEFPIFYLSGRLFQEWIVEMYMVWENEHLDWLRKNQNQCRSDTYNAVSDAVFANERNPASIGQRVYLPASFLGMLFICHYFRI